MNAIKNKLKSNSGASITFALLLFLVCAVISSVVIVASTAAGGRVSQMAKMDQRYYAVSSAAELLRDMLEKQTVVVSRKTETTEDVLINTLDDTTTTTTVGEPDVSYTVKVDDKDLGASELPELPLLGQMAVKHGGLNWPGSSDYQIPDTYQLSTYADDDMLKTLAVEVKVNMKENGTFVLIVYNQDNEPGSTYTLGLTFQMEKSQSTDTRVENGPKLPGEQIGEYKMKTTKTEIVNTTMRWQMTGIQTVNAAGSGEI